MFTLGADHLISGRGLEETGMATNFFSPIVAANLFSQSSGGAILFQSVLLQHFLLDKNNFDHC